MNLHTDAAFTKVHGLVSTLNLNTVCQSAKCPNRHECWNRGTATIMILGDICTRDCSFCAVTTGHPAGLDPDEPARVAEAVRSMALKYVVLTSVTRDDLADGGASAFAETIRAVRSAVPGIRVEVLTPDFKGIEEHLRTVLDAAPDVFGHNLETVRRLQPAIRPQASYDCSLSGLRFAATSGGGIAVKSGVMVGLGESDDELYEAMRDLRDAGCRLLTLGQYLAPTRGHVQPVRFVEPAEFERYAAKARELGFGDVASAPLVRSSYRAEQLWVSG